MQWVLISYAVFSSTSFILVNYWKELSKYLDKKRYILMGVIFACQIGLFCVLKFYFFALYNENMGVDTVVIINNSTAVNSTLAPANLTELIPAANATSNISTLLF